MADKNLVAAQIASALIRIGAGKATSPAEAAKLYVDCLEAIEAEEAKRPKPTAGPISGTYGTSR